MTVEKDLIRMVPLRQRGKRWALEIFADSLGDSPGLPAGRDPCDSLDGDDGDTDDALFARIDDLEDRLRDERKRLIREIAVAAMLRADLAVALVTIDRLSAEVTSLDAEGQAIQAKLATAIQERDEANARVAALTQPPEPDLEWIQPSEVGAMGRPRKDSAFRW